jgi:diguanylate cyclase (GGDEF)-like protein/PAS domain S-box-containing protein
MSAQGMQHDAAADQAMTSDRIEHLVELVTSGALAQHPGPAMIVGRNGAVFGRNMNGTTLAQEYEEQRLPALNAMVDAVLSGAGPQTFKLEDEVISATVDFAVMPIDGADAVLALGRDVSLDQNLRTALVDSRQRYKDLIEISSDFAWETGELGQFVFVSATGALGYEPEDLVGRRAEGFVVTSDGIDFLSPFVTEEPVLGVEVRLRRADGRVAILEASAAPLQDADGVWKGARGLCRDVTEARRRDAALAKSQDREQLTAYILGAIRDEVEPEKMLAAATQSVLKALDADAAALFRIIPGSGLTLSHSAGVPLDPDILEQVREPVTDSREPVVMDDADGTVLAHQLSYHNELNGAVLLWRRVDRPAWDEEEQSLLGEVASQLGIAMRQAEAHRHLHVLSTTDAMTGLLNRRAFQDVLAARLSRKNDGRSGALTYVDLDNFKQVNDVRGHQTGDKALIHLSAILKEQSKPGDLVARLGGDEFALWLEATDRDQAATRAEAILAAGKALTVYSGSPEKPVGLSLGLALRAPGSPESLENLILRADKVMYQVKHGGKGWYRIDVEEDQTKS